MWPFPAARNRRRFSATTAGHCGKRCSGAIPESRRPNCWKHRKRRFGSGCGRRSSGLSRRPGGRSTKQRQKSNITLNGKSCNMKGNLSPHLRDVLGESERKATGLSRRSGLPSQAEGTYQAYGQPASKPLVSIHFITPDGCVRSFQYRHLDSRHAV